MSAAHLAATEAKGITDCSCILLSNRCFSLEVEHSMRLRRDEIPADGWIPLPCMGPCGWIPLPCQWMPPPCPWVSPPCVGESWAWAEPLYGAPAPLQPRLAASDLAQPCEDRASAAEPLSPFSQLGLTTRFLTN